MPRAGNHPQRREAARREGEAISIVSGKPCPGSANAGRRRRECDSEGVLMESQERSGRRPAMQRTITP